MSKIKKKPVESSTTISELDVRFVKIINITGWIYLIAVVGFFAVWGLFDTLLNVIDIETSSPLVYAYIVYTGTSAAFCFAVGSKINKEKENKRSFFMDLLLGEFFFCVLAILSLAIYQW